MNRVSFSNEQITDVVRTHCDPNFDGEMQIIVSKRGSAALVDTSDGRFIVKYADLNNQETEQAISPSRSTGIRNEVQFLNTIPDGIAPRLHATGDDEHAVFSITRFVEGVGLPTEKRPVITGLLTAAQTLHQLGVVHGDMTPDNVLVTNERIYLIDFELAHAMGGAALAPGLCHYLSPDAARAVITGSQPTLDAKEETYALAGTSLAMLVGHMPNIYSQPDVARKQAMQEIASGMRRYNLDGVSDKNQAAAQALESILLSPAEFRPATPLDLLKELEKHL